MRYAFLIIFLTTTVCALTPTERKLVIRARDEVVAARKSLQDAQTENDQAWDSAEQAESRALTAQHQAEVEHSNLVQAVGLVDKWKPQIDQDKRWFGLGRIIFGFVDLGKHLLLLAAGIAVLSLILWGLQFFFPFLRPVLAVILWPFKALWRLITKPKTA
jgi:hypothetical protein